MPVFGPTAQLQYCAVPCALLVHAAALDVVQPCMWRGCAAARGAGACCGRSRRHVVPEGAGTCVQHGSLPNTEPDTCADAGANGSADCGPNATAHTQPNDAPHPEPNPAPRRLPGVCVRRVACMLRGMRRRRADTLAHHRAVRAPRRRRLSVAARRAQLQHAPMRRALRCDRACVAGLHSNVRWRYASATRDGTPWRGTRRKCVSHGAAAYMQRSTVPDTEPDTGTDTGTHRLRCV